MTEATERARDEAARDAKGRFQPGRSGNPAGRQRGSRNRATLLRERLNPAQEALVINKAFDNLLNRLGEGHLGASQLLLDALAPKTRGRAIVLDLPADALAEDILDAAMWDLARGVITLDEALGYTRFFKERQAAQQQEYVSRRARARLAERAAAEAAMAAADARPASDADAPEAAPPLAAMPLAATPESEAPESGMPVSAMPETVAPARAAADAAAGTGPAASGGAEPPSPTVEEVTAEAIRVFAAARALAAAGGDPGAGGPSDPADALQIQVQAELAALVKRRGGTRRRPDGSGLPEAA